MYKRQVQTVAKHLADQCQQYTQYAGARPLGVSLIIGGVDSSGTSLYLTDPSGAYVLYNAVAIGANSDIATEFLEKNYSHDLTLDDAKTLAVAIINLVSEVKEGADHIKMSQIDSESKQFKFIEGSEIKKLITSAKTKYPSDTK